MSVQPVSLWPVNVFVCLNSVRVGFYMGCNKKEKKPGFLNTKLGAEVHNCNPSVGVDKADNSLELTDQLV